MTTDLELSRYRIPKERFNGAPKDERVFFIRALHLLTDINTLQKAVIFSSSEIDTAEPGLKTSAQNAQAMTYIRHLAGVLNEANELLNKGFFAKGLRESYLAGMDETAKTNLNQVTKYFSEKDCLIRDIRMNFAFHYDLTKIDEELDDLSRYDQFDIYLSEAHANCHYVAANDILIFGMIKLTGKKDFKEAFDFIIGETLKIAKCFQDFFGAYQMAFILRHLNSEPTMEKIVLHDVPSMDEIRMPYFLRDPRKK